MLKLYRIGFANPPAFDKNLIAKFVRASSLMVAQKYANDFARGEKCTVVEEKEWVW